MMKKYILILLSVLCCIGCDREDETVDITVMPPATTIGAETFGCLIDGWLYVGGRYRDYGYWFGPSVDSPSIKFLYNQKQRAALSAGMADIASGAPKPAANREVAGSTALQKAIR